MPDLTRTARKLLAAAGRYELVRDYVDTTWWRTDRGAERELTNREASALKRLERAGLVVCQPASTMLGDRLLAVTDEARELEAEGTRPRFWNCGARKLAAGRRP